MLFQLMLKGLKKGKARFACAIAGVAISVGGVVFMTSFVATNREQAPELAARASVPWAAWQIEGIRLMGRRGMPPPAAQGDSPRKGGDRPQMDGDRPRPPQGMRGDRPQIDGDRPRPPQGMRGDRPQMDGDRPREIGGKLPKPDLVLSLLQLTIDYRPGGHVLQGPPMTALMAKAPTDVPYGTTKLVSGRWVNESSTEFEIICTKGAMRRFGHGEPPALGTPIKFLGREGTMTAKIVGYLEDVKLPAGWPTVFANAAAFSAFDKETHGKISFWKIVPQPENGDRPRMDGDRPRLGGDRPQANGDRPRGKVLTPQSEEVVSAFKGDEQRRMDYATPLMLVAAVLTALSLLVNSLLLSVESNRSTLAMLRTVGLTRGGVVRFVMLESLFSGFVGWVVGLGMAMGGLWAYVKMDGVGFPAGVAYDWKMMGVTLVLLLVVACVAVLFALRPALAVRAMDAAAQRPRRRRRGMAVTFACGFAAFVAVEVWGASLMRGFIPSVEWPEAIVSILPGGVSSYDVEKLRTVPGVKRISELVPRQAMMTETEADRAEAAARAKKPQGPMMMGGHNALFLGAEWLPKFKFLEGDWESANKQLAETNAVVITEMMSRARGLHKGDELSVQLRGGRGPAREERFPIAAVVDLNWHMVTSRGLVRGLNGMPGMTDGPVFASLDTMGIVDPRTYMTEPAMSAPMTHLWVEYEPDFLAKHGVFQAGRLIEAEITKRLGNPVGATVRLHARDEIADGTLAHGTDVIGQAARVPFVFLFVLAIGFIAMLVAEVDAARREYAILRAVGATQLQLVTRLAGSAVKTALIGILCGVPLGSLTGWLFSLKTGNWPGMPHYFVIPCQIVAEGAFGAIAFALIFAVPTSLILIARARRNGLGR